MRRDVAEPEDLVWEAEREKGRGHENAMWRVYRSAVKGCLSLGAGKPESDTARHWPIGPDDLATHPPSMSLLTLPNHPPLLTRPLRPSSPALLTRPLRPSSPALCVPPHPPSSPALYAPPHPPFASVLTRPPHPPSSPALLTHPSSPALLTHPSSPALSRPLSPSSSAPL